MPATRTAIERVRYWQGQTLRSSDFNDQLAHDASLRWWHNRAIHNTYGVVAGLRTTVRDEHTVIGPGLAYDCFGRELLSLERHWIALPPDTTDGPQTWRLVLRAASSQALTPTPLDFRWLRAGKPAPPEEGLALALGSWSDGQFALEDLQRQQRIQPLARPRLGSGATVHGKTDWREWLIPHQFGRSVLAQGIQVKVNTGATGFQRTPCYFASLRGDPWIQTGQSILPVVGRVVEATPQSFVFSLWIRLRAQHLFESTAAIAPTPLAQLGRRQWSVCWLGIEAGSVKNMEETKS